MKLPNRYVKRWLNQAALAIILLSLGFFCQARAQTSWTWQTDFDHGDAGATINVTIDCAGNGTYDVQRRHGGSPHIDGVVWFGIANGSGGWDWVFDLNHSGTTVTSGTFTYILGRAVRYAATAMDNSTVLYTDTPETTTVPNLSGGTHTLNLSNTQEHDVRYRIVDSVTGEDLGASPIEVKAGQSVNNVQISLECEQAFEIFYQADNVDFVDGEWVKVRDKTYEEPGKIDGDDGPFGDEVDTSTVEPPDGSGTTVDNTGTTQNPTGLGGTNLWKPDVSDDGVTNETYKQGVDKITKEIARSNQHLSAIRNAITQTGNAPTDWEDTDLPSLDAVTGKFGATSLAIGSAPTVFSGSITPSHVIAFSQVVPGVGGAAGYTMATTMDLSEFETPILFVRGAVAAMCWLLYYLLIVRTTRNLGAN